MRPDPVSLLWKHGDAWVEWEAGTLIFFRSDTAEACDIRGALRTFLATFAEERYGGRVVGSGFLLRLRPEVVLAPALAFIRAERLSQIHPTHLEGGADLVIEIVSPDSRMRDRGEKFYEYEKAGIEEYWIVDPERRSAEFYRLDGGIYRPVLPDAEGKVYASALPGFFIRVEWLWNRPKVLDALRELGVV